MGEYVLEVNNITKVFPGVVANDNVSLNVKPGEIMGLIGENGAGKSTILKIINGIYPAGSYEGEIKIDGEVVRPASPVDAVHLGIGFVPQEVSVFRFESVPENIYMGDLTLGKKTFWVNQRELRRHALDLINELQLEIDVDMDPRKMSIGQQQMLMIAKALSSKPRILILDEPTTSLSNRDVANLFRVVRHLRENGTGIIFVTHKMDEIMELTDRVTVLRDGHRVGEFEKKDYNRDKIIAAMIGREVTNMYPERHVEIGDEVLRVENMTVSHPYIAHRNLVEDINFSVHAGEVLGFAGLVGSGRSEALMSVYGVNKLKSGKIYLNGKRITINGPADAMSKGISLVTEDRKKYGLLFSWSIMKNISITNYNAICKGPFLSEKTEAKRMQYYFDTMRVKAPKMGVLVDTLSGGNQQKVVIARSFNAEQKVLILDEPTKGIDVGSKSEIYQLINGFAEQGIAVIMISSELPELLNMCDRFIVMAEGRIVGELSKEEADEISVMRMATTTFKKIAQAAE